ncbi:MAG: ACT domain-containing protein, partial [Lachnospiraceae bacterium]|nr:ACT domain-containing protein [Lachnospiraceae bacterium]
MKTENKNRTIITVVGMDAVGIIAKICTYLSGNNINVLDISQTIVDGFFNMMMIVDLTQSDMPFTRCQKELGQIGEEIGVEIRAQKEEIFRTMHRV